MLRAIGSFEFMIWIIMFLNLLLLLLAVVSLVSSFTKGRSAALQITAVISSFIPLVLGAIVWMFSARVGGPMVEISAIQDPAMMEMGRRTAMAPFLLVGVLSTIVLLSISGTALMIRLVKRKSLDPLGDDPPVEFV